MERGAGAVDQPAGADHLIVCRLARLKQSIELGEAAQNLVGLVLVRRQIVFEFRIRLVLHLHHLFAEYIAQIVNPTRQLPLDQRQGNGVALLRFHVHHAGRIQAQAFQ